MAFVVCTVRVSGRVAERWNQAAIDAACSRGGIIEALVTDPTCPTRAQLRGFRSRGPFAVRVSFHVSRDALKALRRLRGRAMTQGEAIRRLLLVAFGLWAPGRPRPDHPRPHPVLPQAPRAPYLAVSAAAKRRLPEGHADRALGPTDPVLYHPPEEA
jgi:hypothetical protein